MRCRRCPRGRPGRAQAANNVAWFLATTPDESLRDGPYAVTLAERSEELTRLAECLEGLPPGGRALVDMYYAQSKNAAQIAAETNERHGSIRMRLLRLRQALRRCMESRLGIQGA